MKFGIGLIFHELSVHSYSLWRGLNPSLQSSERCWTNQFWHYDHIHPLLKWYQTNCLIHSFLTLCHNLLIKVAKVVQVNKHCPKRPQKSVNWEQWIWQLDFQLSFSPTIWRKCLIALPFLRYFPGVVLFKIKFVIFPSVFVNIFWS